MRVQVVPQQGDGPEGPPTQVAFVRPLVRVALHVSVQVGAARTRVAAQLTLERLLHTWFKGDPAPHSQSCEDSCTLTKPSRAAHLVPL